MTKNVALEMLKAASAEGFTLEVYCEGEREYSGQSHQSAWEACKAVEECTVQIRRSDRKLIGSMTVIAGLDKEENVADYGDQPGETWVNDNWNRIFRYNEEAA